MKLRDATGIFLIISSIGLFLYAYLQYTLNFYVNHKVYGWSAYKNLGIKIEKLQKEQRKASKDVKLYDEIKLFYILGFILLLIGIVLTSSNDDLVNLLFKFIK